MINHGLGLRLNILRYLVFVPGLIPTGQLFHEYFDCSSGSERLYS